MTTKNISRFISRRADKRRALMRMQRIVRFGSKTAEASLMASFSELEIAATVYRKSEVNEKCTAAGRGERVERKGRQDKTKRTHSRRLSSYPLNRLTSSVNDSTEAHRCSSNDAVRRHGIRTCKPNPNRKKRQQNVYSRPAAGAGEERESERAVRKYLSRVEP